MLRNCGRCVYNSTCTLKLDLEWEVIIVTDVADYVSAGVWSQ